MILRSTILPLQQHFILHRPHRNNNILMLKVQYNPNQTLIFVLNQPQHPPLSDIWSASRHWSQYKYRIDDLTSPTGRWIHHTCTMYNIYMYARYAVPISANALKALNATVQCQNRIILTHGVTVTSRCTSHTQRRTVSIPEATQRGDTRVSGTCPDNATALGCLANQLDGRFIAAISTARRCRREMSPRCTRWTPSWYTHIVYVCMYLFGYCIRNVSDFRLYLRVFCDMTPLHPA